MAVTLRREPQELQVMKYNRFSPLLSSVSGDLQVLQVTYSTFSLLAIVLDHHRVGDEHTDVSSKDILNLFLLETALDYQSSASIN